MKSVGETMAIGRTFKEALQKGLRGLETGRAGLGYDGKDDIDEARLKHKLKTPGPDRIFYIHHALANDMGRDEVHALTGVDPWFLRNIEEIIEMEHQIAQMTMER